MTQAEYARYRGVTQEAVRKAVKSGRITLRNGQLDPAEADREWAERTDHARRGVTSEGSSSEYWAAKTEAEIHRAALLKLDLAERERQLVTVEHLAQAHAAIVNETRAALAGTLPAMSLAIASESDPREVAILMEAAFRAVCVELQRALGERAKEFGND